MIITGDISMKQRIIGCLMCIIIITFQGISIGGTTDKYLQNEESLNQIEVSLQNNGKNLKYISWIEQAKITATDGKPNDFFGSAVSVSGNYAIVGAYKENNGIGAAYIFKRTNMTWHQEQKLIATDGVNNDYFGCSVSIDGNYAIVGAYGDDNSTGAAYIFNHTGGAWLEDEKILAPDGANNDLFGRSVSMDGNFVIIGANGDDDFKGAAYIYENCCYWKIREKVNTSSGLPYFGKAVSMSGDYAIVGAPGEPGTDSVGSAYIFKREGNRWFEHTYWNGEKSGEYLGVSVSIDGSYAIAGTHGMNNSGSVYVFKRNDTTWIQEQKLIASDSYPNNYFGASVSIDAGYIIIGAYGVNSNTGSAYIFNRSVSTWIEEQKLLASDIISGDFFGTSVSIDAGYAVIGAMGDNSNTGSSYVFAKSGVPDLSIKILGGIGIKAVITNDGDNDAQNIDFNLFVHGGIYGMINKSITEKIEILSGESITISTGLLLGFGKISIQVRVDFEEKTKEGTQLLIFSIVKK
jgi:hypothetical protein